MLSDRLSYALWPNGWTDQDETWHAGRPRPWPHCVRWGPSSPPKGHSPQFSTRICCGQMATWIKMSVGMELGLGPGDFVLEGTPLPLPKRGAEAPQFLAHVYCGQTAGWMKLVLGMEVGLSSGDFVLDGDLAPPPKGVQLPSPIFGPFQDATWYGCRPQPRGLCVRWRTSHPPRQGGEAPQIFGPCLLWPNGWMDQDVTWYGGRPRPAYATLCSMWTQLPTEKRAHPFPPNFWPMPLVAKWLDG